MGSALAVEVVASDSTGPTLTLGKTSNADLVARFKNVGGNLLADLQVICKFFNAELAHDLWHDTRVFKMTGSGLTEVLDLFCTELHGGITIGIDGLHLRN